MTNRTDNFNRSNRSLSGDTPSDSGGTWTVTGTWNILSNLVYKPSDFNTSQVAYLESSVATVDVVATYISLGNAGLVARLSDSSNYIYGRVNQGNVIVYKNVAGSFTQLGSTYTGTISVPTTWTLSVSGNNIVLKEGATARVTTSDAHNNTATKHGLGDFSSSDASWDDFSITEAGGGGGTFIPIIGGGPGFQLAGGRGLAS